MVFAVIVLVMGGGKDCCKFSFLIQAVLSVLDFLSLLMCMFCLF